MRRKGSSIKEIADKLRISKSTASAWCTDIVLTKGQLENLRRRMVEGGHKGRLLGARMQREKKMHLMEEYQKEGTQIVRKVDGRDLLMLGIGLHLGEGNKSGHKFQLTNSNPELVRLALLWLIKILKVKKGDLILNVMINNIHSQREKELLFHWSRITGVPKRQFNKTIFIKSKNKKVYDNFFNHFGTLVIRVRKSSRLQYKVLGLRDAVLSLTKGSLSK